MPGPGENEACTDGQVERRIQTIETPPREQGSYWGEMLMQIISIKMRVCDCTHSRKVQAEERPDPPPYAQLTTALEVHMEPRGVVGRLS